MTHIADCADCAGLWEEMRHAQELALVLLHRFVLLLLCRLLLQAVRQQLFVVGVSIGSLPCRTVAAASKLGGAQRVSPRSRRRTPRYAALTRPRI